MKSLLQFIKEFVQNKGLLVFSSIIFSKFSFLFINIIAARLITEEDLGKILLIASVFNVFVTVSGWGSNQGLLRYGNLMKDDLDKDSLSKYLLWTGFRNQIMVTILFFLISVVYITKYESIFFIIPFFAIRLIGFYFFNHIQADYRIRNKNKEFAVTNIFVNFISLVLVLILTYFFSEIGYLTALALSPWFAVLFFKKNKSSFKPLNINLKEFWKYSFHASITYFLSDLLFSMDILLLGFLLDDVAVANYKLAIIIPMNLSFLPLTFMQTDFPKLAKNYQNKTYLQFYIKNYYRIFIPVGISILFFGYLVKDWIISFVFGENYQGNGWTFYIILCALVGNMWLRNLYGNLASAIGKASWNTYIAIGALIIIIVLGFLLIPTYELIGAAIGMAVAFSFTGIAGALLFHQYLRNLKSEKNY